MTNPERPEAETPRERRLVREALLWGFFCGAVIGAVVMSAVLR